MRINHHIILGNDEREDLIEIKVDGKTAKLSSDILHYTYDDIEAQASRLNHYSTLWAKEAYKNGKKSNLLRLFLSPVGTFLNVYFIRLGLLDGFPGLVISTGLAYYSFLKKAKLRQLYRESRDDKS